MHRAEGSYEPRRSVFVAEDQNVLGFVGRVLRRAGYQMVPAINGAGAHDVFCRHASELVLIVVGLVLPGMSGAKFVNALPTLEPRIPILFTICPGEFERDLAGPSLQKPFSAAELQRAISDACFGYPAAIV